MQFASVNISSKEGLSNNVASSLLGNRVVILATLLFLIARVTSNSYYKQPTRGVRTQPCSCLHAAY